MDSSHLARLIDSTHTGYIHIDSSGKVLGINNTAAQILGTQNQAAAGQHYQSILRGELSGTPIAFIQKTMKSGEHFSAERISFKTTEGKSVSVECSGFQLNDPILGLSVIVTFRDISKQIEIEDKLKDAIQEQLNHEQKLRQALHDLQELNEQLRSTQDQLTQAEKMRSVGHLAAGVAHEVKNPLAILLQGMEYLDRYSDLKSEESKAIIVDMIDAIQRADAVIKQLLDFASPGDPEKVAEDIHETIDRTINLVKHLVSSRNINIEKIYDRRIAPVKIDKNGIEQVLINLLSNAIFAMSEGGNLTIRTEVGYKDGSDRIVIYIEDTGSGIPEEVLQKIFEPFVTTRRGKGGTGLGLAVAKSIIEKHGGEISISNKPSGGARASIIL